MTVIAIILALQNQVNEKQVKIIKELKKCLPYKFYIAGDFKSLPDYPERLIDLHIENIDESLWDFSRYQSMLRGINPEHTVLMFNDTFGCGRNINRSIIFFIKIAICLINQGKYKLAAPVDSDEYGKWVCPYFMIGKAGFLQTLNWTDFHQAKKRLSYDIRKKCHIWIRSGWRHSMTANRKQRLIKLRTLYLERDLVDISNVSIYRFDRKNILRILNRYI